MRISPIQSMITFGYKKGINNEYFQKNITLKQNNKGSEGDKKDYRESKPKGC